MPYTAQELYDMLNNSMPQQVVATQQSLWSSIAPHVEHPMPAPSAFDETEPGDEEDDGSDDPDNYPEEPYSTEALLKDYQSSLEYWEGKYFNCIPGTFGEFTVLGNIKKYKKLIADLEATMKPKEPDICDIIASESDE